jgi:2-polyprenyl-6-methoxyphenol hydroxylase-like FAD-dependent oxidoreductase
MKAEATDLIEDGGRIVGLRADTPDGKLEIRADLVVGADGRHSIVREKAGLKERRLRRADGRAVVSRHAQEQRRTDAFGHVEAGKMLVMLDRGDYWQCAYVIPRAVSRRSRRRGSTRSATVSWKCRRFSPTASAS